MIAPVSGIGNWGNPFLYSAGSYLQKASEVAGSLQEPERTRPLLLGEEDPEDKDKQTGIDDRIAKRTGKKECQTCKNRKYVDGSDENVSFKSAAKINPAAVESRVRAHEMEHVANAYDKAEQTDSKVLRASVRLKYAICPECGRSYCAGGETTTVTRSSGKENDTPYDRNARSFGREAALGNNIDEAV